jgi:ATP-binding cassette, subfamily B, bacterial
MNSDAGVLQKKEFRAEKEFHYNRRGPVAWIVSHTLRYPLFPIVAILAAIINNFSYSEIPVAVGNLFDMIVKSGWQFQGLLAGAILIGVLAVSQGVFGLARNFSIEFIAQRIERDARDELYASLLGKSQTFHGRQRIGDVMARCTNDVRTLNGLFSPGVMLIIDSSMAIVAPYVLVAILDYRLLIMPSVFLVLLVITVWDYNRRLAPVSMGEREQFGNINSELEEDISGVEIIKSNAQEAIEHGRFKDEAKKYRDLYIRQGIIQSKYFPMLAFTICQAIAFLHGLFLWRSGAITVGQFISFMGLMNVFRFPTFISLFSFNLVQMGIAGAKRILELINAESELDENKAGVSKEIRGKVEFRNVSFSYDSKPVLHSVTFTIEPGETVAIVGKTGSGKSTLTRLLNRIYDATSGSIVIDEIDVKEWSLESLRSQISSIEQDIFLFSWTIAENIAFGIPGVERSRIEEVARAACAHDFILEFKDGYDTVIGERGITLSGGQRQRIAIARAFLTNPRVLVLDDSTSAIDSQTEDEIQRAMRRVAKNRTTFIITHRLSQIRWASRILVLDRGSVAAFGTHDELIKASPEYARIFVRD